MNISNQSMHAPDVINFSYSKASCNSIEEYTLNGGYIDAFTGDAPKVTNTHKISRDTLIATSQRSLSVLSVITAVTKNDY